jgi:hypothetical protein
VAKAKKGIQIIKSKPTKQLQLPVSMVTVTDNEQVELILTENGLIKHFDKKSDHRMFDNENLTIYIFWGEFNKYGKQRDSKERGFAMVRCSTKEEYNQMVAGILNF